MENFRDLFEKKDVGSAKQQSGWSIMKDGKVFDDIYKTEDDAKEVLDKMKKEGLPKGRFSLSFMEAFKIKSAEFMYKGTLSNAKKAGVKFLKYVNFPKMHYTINIIVRDGGNPEFKIMEVLFVSGSFGQDDTKWLQDAATKYGFETSGIFNLG